ncbi:MAG: hypothetical protein IKQ99_01935 [Alphaproteobacteria bacterium]|nr:hypothetical protein [Alphaproteobacteria bacterium]
MSLKERCKNIMDDTRDAVDCAISSPVDFALNSMHGMALLTTGLFTKGNSMRRLYDDRCKSCARLTLRTLLAVGLVFTGYKCAFLYFKL